MGICQGPWEATEPPRPLEDGIVVFDAGQDFQRSYDARKAIGGRLRSYSRPWEAPVIKSIPLPPHALDCEVLVLSDLHLHSGYEDLGALRTLFERAHPRGVILAGDVANRHALERGALTPERRRAMDDLGGLLVDLRSRAEIIYVRGNHDPGGGILPGLGVVPSYAEIPLEWQGRRFLVTHGHRTVRRSLLRRQIMGSFLTLRRQMRFLSPRGASARRIKLSPLARSLERLFARRWLRRARREGYDGVLCGHIHIPELRRLGRHIYANCGDWVDCNTFLALSHRTIFLGSVPPGGRGALLLRQHLPLDPASPPLDPRDPRFDLSSGRWKEG